MEPRGLLPLTDDELKHLYQKALAAVPDETVVQSKRSAGLICRLLDGLVYVAICMTFFPLHIRLMWSLLLFLGAIVSSFVGPKFIGLFSFFDYESSKRPVVKDPTDLSDPKVMKVVVQYLTREPLSQYRAIEHKVRVNRVKIAESISSLGKLIDELVVESGAGDQTLEILRKSRLEQAQRSRAKLEVLDTHLATQLREADLAVAPIREIEAQLSKALQVSEDISKIHAAHGLIEDTEANIEDNRLQIQVLRSITERVAGSLRSIELDVKARELAEDEVLKLQA